MQALPVTCVFGDCNAVARIESPSEPQPAGEPMFFMLRANGSISYAGDRARRYFDLPPEASYADVLKHIDRRDLVRFRQRLRTPGNGDIEERIHVRNARGEVHEGRAYATFIRGPESANHWLGFFEPGGVLTERRTRKSSERDLSLQNLMSGNDCVELLSLDERLWAMSMNGKQMPEPTASTIGLWSDFWNERERPAAIQALDELGPDESAGSRAVSQPALIRRRGGTSSSLPFSIPTAGLKGSS